MMCDVPAVSLIIPVRETSPDILLEKLRALHDGEFTDFEIVVVDDCSPVDMRPFTGFALVRDCLRLDDPMPFNMPAAKNAGARVARSDWLMFSDVDVVFGSGEIRRLIESAAGGDCVIGQTMIPDGKGWKPHKHWQRRICCLAAVRRKLFDLVGGFEESMRGHYGYEDDLFFARVKKRGRIVWTEAARARMRRLDKGAEELAGARFDLQTNREKYHRFIISEGLDVGC